MTSPHSNPPQDTVLRRSSITTSPIRAYRPPVKTAALSPSLSATLAATLASKKAYINLPSIHKVIATHSKDTHAPNYDETLASIPVLDLLPPPPVYDIVNCSTSQTLLLVSSLINTILEVNDRLACPKITLFHSRAIPNISIEAYLSRILQYAPFQNEVLLIILLYFDRIGGGCKPTQVLTNTIPRALLRKGSLATDISHRSQSPQTLLSPKQESKEDSPPAAERSTSPHPQSEELDRRLSSQPSLSNIEATSGPGEPEEEEPIVDEIYTSSSESPVGSKLIINSFNIHRLLITSILVASKFSSDVFYPNVRYARVGGLPLSELNQLELEFLFLSQFELNTTESELQAYGNKLLMYHQRLNGVEKAAVDSVPCSVQGEYPGLSEKKLAMQTSLKQGHHTAVEQQIPPPPPQRHSADVGHYVHPGPYRDSKEIPDQDEDENMSEVAEPVGSPTAWQSGQSTPVIRTVADTPKLSSQRSNKMNLDHMIWPTNEMETKHTPGAHYGGMVMDEEAARIEEEFNKPSPPPESVESTPKRKLQRLSSGTMETTPAKRANTPSKNMGDKVVSQPGSNKSILRPFLRKIASFAHRNEATAPEPAPEATAQPPAQRSHPYLVRHRISPASSSTHLAMSPPSEAVTSPTTPNEQNAPWQHRDHPLSSHTRGESTASIQMKPPPPPYCGQDQGPTDSRGEHDRSSRQSQLMASRPTSTPRGKRQHRSREPSLSSLASELTFEPTRSSLSPMREETTLVTEPRHPSTLAPFYFPPRPQSVQTPQSYSTPPDTPMVRKEDLTDGRSHDSSTLVLDPRSPSGSVSRSLAERVDEDAMQCDDDEDEELKSPMSTSVPSPTLSNRSSVSGSATKASGRTAAKRMEESSSPSTIPQRIEPTQAHAGRHWIPRNAPASIHPGPFPHPHPHYVASYYPTHGQLVHTLRGPQAMVAAHPGMMTMSRTVPATPAPTVRPARQFAPIRPRTPMTLEEEQNARAAQPTTETKKKAEPKPVQQRRASGQAKLRPLVPTLSAPPPYRPPFFAYPSPYGGPMSPGPGQQVAGAPMMMAVDYHGAHGPMSPGYPPQFLAAGQNPGQGPTRIYIPVIPVVYNKPVAAPVPVKGKATSTPAKIAPRLHRPS